MGVYFVGAAALTARIKSVEAENNQLNSEIEILRSMEFGGVGRIEKYAASIPPENTIKANGAELSRETFWRLWEYAQASGNIVDQASKQRGQFGTGNGSTTFTIPDHRGVASRGFDDGAGLDSAPTLGRYQGDENKSHSHSTSRAGNHRHSISSTGYSSSRGGVNTSSAAASGTYSVGTSAQGAHFHSITRQGARENTVKNVSFMYCIRYQ